MRLILNISIKHKMKYPPLVIYKQLKGGNSTFGGIFTHHMKEILEYLNMRLHFLTTGIIYAKKLKTLSLLYPAS